MFNFSDSDVLAQLEKPGNNGTGLVERKVRVQAWFYMHAILDEVASKREGRKIYKDAPYVSRRAQGDKDFISGPVQLSDTVTFPAEWQAFQDWLRNPRTSVKSLPKMTPAAFRTCEELEIPTIEDLAAAPSVPPELSAHQAMAQAWVALSNPEVKKQRAPYGSRKKHAQDAKAAA